tara:strand:+ start:1941 stop:2255 length:315 start_codon:yes stop_codon:yes gene_type:complete
MTTLIEIKKTIECLNKTRQVEILKIFLKNNVSISENNNGTFINLSFLSEDCLNELKEYLNYIKDQEASLKTLENVKDEFIKEYFENNVENHNKETTPVYNNNYA